MQTTVESPLALLGGPRTVQSEPGDMFSWPIVTPAMETAVLEVLRAGAMSDTGVTVQFEQEYAAWHGMTHALAHSSGTAALHGAFFGVGVGVGDEIICPAMTYWASGLPAYSLGATVVFADIEAQSLCIDPRDIEHRITERTRAIVAVHYAGHPADMDPIMEIARRHGVPVIEDVSHAHGALYKGRMVGTIGDVSAASLMSGKSFAVGEGGILLTNDRRIYERAIVFGHYERHDQLTEADLVAGAGLPWGGYKYRMHQLSSAVGRVQLTKYAAEMAEIDRAMTRFWDQLEGLPGIRPHRPSRESGSTMGGWYAARGLYRPEEVGGLPVERFCAALRAEGVPCSPGGNLALHLHPVFTSVDVYGHGRPTRIANLPAGTDIRQPRGSLPVAEGLQEHVFGVPWFKHDRPAVIAEHAQAVRKVVEHYGDLLDGEASVPSKGSWGLTKRTDGA